MGWGSGGACASVQKHAGAESEAASRWQLLAHIQPEPLSLRWAACSRMPGDRLGQRPLSQTTLLAA